MYKLNYQSPPPVQSSNLANTPVMELVTPMIVLMIGLLLFGGGAFYQARFSAAYVGMGLVFLLAGIQTVLGMGAILIAAKIIRCRLGELGPALLKLTAITVFSSALYWNIPYGWAVSVITSIGLLVWLLTLEIL